LNILDRITERTGYRPAVVDVSLRLRIRELAERFALELIEALRYATLPEVAKAMDALDQYGAKRRVSRAPSSGGESRGKRVEGVADRGRPAIRLAPQAAGRALGQTSVGDRPSARTSGARSPFDITMPGELLDAVESDSERPRMVPVAESSPAPARRVRHSPASSLLSDQAPPEAPTSKVPEATPTPDVAPPTVALRAGERVLRATGSGVVIRRIRPV
jgi:hypothetical protein